MRSLRHGLLQRPARHGLQELLDPTLRVRTSLEEELDRFPDGLFADAKLADDFERFRVSTARERTTLLSRVRKALAEKGNGR